MSRGGLKWLWDEAHVWIFSVSDPMILITSSQFPSYVSIFIIFLKLRVYKYFCRIVSSSCDCTDRIERSKEIMSVNRSVYLKQSINSIYSTCLTFQILKDSHCVL
jgi:hypothetical protein